MRRGWRIGYSRNGLIVLSQQFHLNSAYHGLALSLSLGFDYNVINVQARLINAYLNDIGVFCLPSPHIEDLLDHVTCSLEQWRP